MRLLAIILNTALLLVAGYLMIDEMDRSLDLQEVLVMALFITTPTLTLICLVLGRHEGKGWLALYLQRKALEEKRRIDDLNRDHRTGQGTQ